jgi:hypothetical protein
VIVLNRGSVLDWMKFEEIVNAANSAKSIGEQAAKLIDALAVVKARCVRDGQDVDIRAVLHPADLIELGAALPTASTISEIDRKKFVRQSRSASASSAGQAAAGQTTPASPSSNQPA